MCACKYVYVRVQVCTCARASMYMYACKYVHVRVQVCTCARASMYMHVRVQVCTMCACKYVLCARAYMYACKYVHVRVQVCTCTRASMYYVRVQACAYKSKYAHVHTMGRASFACIQTTGSRPVFPSFACHDHEAICSGS